MTLGKYLHIFFSVLSVLNAKTGHKEYGIYVNFQNAIRYLTQKFCIPGVGPAEVLEAST